MSADGQKPAEIRLPSGQTASSLLYELLREAVERHPDILAAADFPADARAFRSGYADALVRFEARRASSERRAEIARELVRAAGERLRFGSEERDLPLGEYWSRPAEPLRVETLPRGQRSQLTPSVPWQGRTYVGKELHELADAFLAGNLMTRNAADALRWITDQAEAGGGIDLAGHKFAVLGAGAELAATRLLLEAGASVLWIDLAEPGEIEASLGGSISYVPGGADLLRQPREIAETVAQFAGDDRVHLALYAYAAGGGREWRLTAAMNGIARCLDPDTLRSVTLLVSPTSPAVIQPEDLEAAAERRPRWWQSLLERAGLLQPGPYEAGGVEIARAIVPLQGASYQAAQYIEKILLAEGFAEYGTRLDGRDGIRPTVSANVAGISRTRSLSHPVFEAAFLGSTLFGVTTFAPATTRALSGLLAVHDLLNPDAPGSASRVYPDAATRAAALFSQQVHGGVYSQPWAVERCITAAAVIGLGRRPALLWRLLRGRR